MRNVFFWILNIAFGFGLLGQVNKVIIVDKETNEPLVGVNITWGEKGEGMVSDIEGSFNKSLLKKVNGGIHFSYIGYRDRIMKFQELRTRVVMERDSKTLSEVVISKKDMLTANQIIDSVKFHLEENHVFDYADRKFFLRQVDEGGVEKLDVHIKKSTIKEFDDDFAKKMINEMPKENDFLTEIIGQQYGDLKKRKLKIKEGYKAYDTDGTGFLENYYKKLETIMNDHVKSDSYFKIRTGLLSFKADADEVFLRDGDVVDVRNDLGSKKKQANAFLNDRKEVLEHIFEDVFLRKDSEVDFLYDSDKYDFEYADQIDFTDQEIYLIKFKPNSSRKYKGKIYVDETDFSILRVEFESVKELMSFSLLGLSFTHKANRGVVAFQKNDQAKNTIKYIKKEADIQFGIDRPFVITEKNKNTRGRRTQNKMKFDMDMTGNFKSSFDYVVLGIESLDSVRYGSVKESNAMENKDWSRYQKGDYWKSNTNVVKANSIIQDNKEVILF